MDLIYSLVNAGANAVANVVRDISTVVDSAIKAPINAGVEAGQAMLDTVQSTVSSVVAQATGQVDKAKYDADTQAAILTIQAFNDAGVIHAYVDNAGRVQQGAVTDKLGMTLSIIQENLMKYFQNGIAEVGKVITGLQDNVTSFVSTARQLLDKVNGFQGEMIIDIVEMFVKMFWDSFAEAL